MQPDNDDEFPGSAAGHIGAIRCAFIMLYAWLMGWPRVSVFDGGWFEWSNDTENPFETGVPE
ncbi:MAG: hypothetical protein L3J31_04290 [Bacteroidales bacterium]|nr:hypothetical protein [Bacteroidales bacterium]